MRSVDEHDHLPWATRARTILAGRHRVDVAELEPAGSAGGSSATGPRSSAPAAGLLEWADGLYLLLPPTGSPPRGRMQLTCRAPVAGLGVLRLVGTAGPAARLRDLPALMDLFAARRSAVSNDEGADDVRPCALSVVPVTVDTVRLLIPATRRRRAHAVPVELEAYRGAAPDLWVLEGPKAAARLETKHQRELRRLAARLGNRFVSAVVVRRVTGKHLDLGCLDAGGVTALTVPLGAAVRHPAGLDAWLHEAARAS